MALVLFLFFPSSSFFFRAVGCIDALSLFHVKGRENYQIRYLAFFGGHL